MKSYTDLEQSKKLANILPIESADMWLNFYSITTDDTTPRIIHLDTPWAGNFNWDNKPDNIPCWSLAALLKVLPDYTLNRCVEYYTIICNGLTDAITAHGYTLIDACVEMAEKLDKEGILKVEDKE